MRIITLFFILLISFSSFAVEPDEVLKDSVLETRALSISRNLRCLVCQGESIDESNSELAKDLRVLVRERIKFGDSDAEVIEFLRERYGDFILFNPPFSDKTLFLWLFPSLIFLIGFFVAYRVIKRAP